MTEEKTKNDIVQITMDVCCVHITPYVGLRCTYVSKPELRFSVFVHWIRL